jgi:hypothetical protein
MATDTERYHRLAVKYLIDMERLEASALLINTQIVESQDYDETEFDVTVYHFFTLLLPPHVYKELNEPDNEIVEDITNAFSYVVELDTDYERNKSEIHKSKLYLELDFKDFTSQNWRQEARELLNSMSKYSNQAIDYWNSGVMIWQELRFRSTEEIMIAEALEKAGVMFLPNCKARCGDPGKRQSIEADFLIYYQGKLGVLEIDGSQHAGQLAKEQERDRIFQHSGVTTVQRYTAQEVRKDTSRVVSEFLRLLTKSS